MKLDIETKIMNPLIGKEIPLPTYATGGSAGIDLRACISAPITLEPGDTNLIGSGLAIHINNPGMMAVLVARSGLGVKHGIIVAQAAGIIDSDYTGEVFVGLWNRSSKPYTIEPGERIAQMIFVPVTQGELRIVEEFSNATERGAGGFGSTGTN